MAGEDKNKAVTYDAVTISNAEIVAPQIDKTQPMLEVRALRQAMSNSSTCDAVKAVVGDNLEIKASEAPLVLRAVAAILTAQRQAKKSVTADAKQGVKSVMTADEINAMNHKIYHGA